MATEANGRRSARRVRYGVVAVLLLGGLGWATLQGVQRLESNNAFCNGCHVDGVSLHTTQFRQLTSGADQSLAAAHAVRVRDTDGAPRAMRCVDCHRGVSLPDRVRFNWIAFRDLVVYLAGRGREPSSLSRPMPDIHCTGCHSSLDGGRFHLIRAHQGEMGVRCTSCHRVHEPGTGPARTEPVHLRSQCARCHPGLGPRVLQLAGFPPPAGPAGGGLPVRR